MKFRTLIAAALMAPAAMAQVKTEALPEYATPYYLDKTSMFKAMPDAEGEIIFFGDSITDRCEWNELFPGLPILNRGLSGDRTEGALARLNEVTSRRPALLFIMIGVNDIRHNTDMQTVLNNYRSIIDNIKTESPDTRIIIQSVLPVNNDVKDAKTENKEIIELNAGIKEIAEENRLPFVNLFPLMLDENGNLKPEYTSDGLHINGEAYMVWKSEIQEYIDGLQLKLKRIIEVEGRQGIAADSQYYYVSGSKVLYKYDKEGNLISKNENPFEGFKSPANHLGDIDVYGSYIYTGCEWFEDGRGKDIQIVLYDKETLKPAGFIPWDPESGQVEVSGISVDAQTGLIWMTDWVNGSEIYKYNLNDGTYAGKVTLTPAPKYQQGILARGGNIYITADDGDADSEEHDNLYLVNPDGGSGAAVKKIKSFTEFKRAGEIEGLTIDPVTGEFLVLMNRGTRIKLGMPVGFYPGYDREIHEVYIYEISE